MLTTAYARNQALAVCLGFGWDSSAMLIEMHRRGIRPDLITFADHGGEKSGTYDFIPLFSAWCRDHGFPTPAICRYQPKPATSARYRAAVVATARRMGLQLEEHVIDRLAGIVGNMLANATLPGIAFGPKSCSVKWKLEAQEPVRIRQAALRNSWANGLRVKKAIGFDCTEDHRATYADASGLKLCPERGLPSYGQRYEVWYPLRDWGMDRAACGRAIVGAGLPLPPKSSCFFCPAMQKQEIEELATEDPTLYAIALEMERLYRTGPHFRGDDLWSVTAKHRETGEKVTCTLTARDAAHARSQFRQAHGDTCRPYRYSLGLSQAVVGLGRHFAWQQLPIVSVA